MKKFTLVYTRFIDGHPFSNTLKNLSEKELNSKIKALHKTKMDYVKSETKGSVLPRSYKRKVIDSNKLSIQITHQ